MRKFGMLSAVMILFLSAAVPTHAQQRKFGLGVIIGEPTGISAKLWTSGENAFDFGLGWSHGGDRIGSYDCYYDNETQRVHFHMDYLWHSFNAIRSTERFPLYYGVGARLNSGAGYANSFAVRGVGGRLNSGAGYANSFAVRGVFGIAWMPRTTPIDIFVELVPSLQLSYGTGFGVDAGVGIRYFF